MHETRRRLWTRLAFVACCVAPTLAIGSWCVTRHLPGRTTVAAQAIEATLGLRATLEAISHLRPGTMLYEGLTLADPETGETILRCRTVETHHDGETLVLAVTHLEIETAGARHVWQRIERLLRQELSPGGPALRIDASEVTLHAAEGSQTFTDVQGAVGPSGPGQEATLEFRLAGINMPEPATVRITRSVAGNQPVTHYEFDTGSTPLPCSAFAPLASDRETVGPKATFRGQVEGEFRPDGGTGKITGVFALVELDTLVTEHFPHTFTGQAEITIDEARFEHGRAIEAQGSVSAGPGTISRSLLTSAAEHLRLGDNEWLPTDRIVSYAQLALRFTLDDAGLALHGECEDETPGAILITDSGPKSRRVLWREPREPQPVAALLRTLVPASQVQVPAARETDWLMHHLPIPDVVPPTSGRDTPPPEARLRVGNTIRE